MIEENNNSLKSIIETLNKKKWLISKGCSFKTVYDNVCGITPTIKDRRYKFDVYYCYNCKHKLRAIQKVLDIIELTERTIKQELLEEKK